MSIRKGGKILATGGSSVKDQNTKQVLKFWSGTLAEYEALGEWHDDMLYSITDDDTHEELVNVATTEKAGIVQPDGSTILVQDGIISAAIPEIDTSNLATKDDIANMATKDEIPEVITSYNDLTDKPEIPAPYELPIASTDILGGVKVDGETITILNGIISAASSGGSGEWQKVGDGNEGYIYNPNIGFKIYWANYTISVPNMNGIFTTSRTFKYPFNSIISYTHMYLGEYAPALDSVSNTAVTFSGIGIEYTYTARVIILGT